MTTTRSQVTKHSQLTSRNGTFDIQAIVITAETQKPGNYASIRGISQAKGVVLNGGISCAPKDLIKLRDALTLVIDREGITA